MAIAFARMEVISRSNGGSATRTAAYIHRIEVKDSRSGERFDFRHSAQAGDQHGVLLPEGAPDWMPDPARLWDAAERAERRKDSQTAYHIVVALPKATDGLGAEDQRALVESFAREQWGRHGLAVSFAIHPPHEGEDNWHAHILVTTRRVEGNGLVTRKARDLNPAFTRSVEGGLHVDGERWGALWAEHQNRYFEAQGLELRVDRKGVISQEHLGPKRHRADPEAEMRQERAEAEAETAIAWRDPGTVLTLMTRTRATFTFAELDRELGKALPVTAERERVRRAVLGDAALIRLRDWGGGAALDRYTTRAVIAEERCVLDDIGRTLKHRHRVDPAVMAAVAARRTLRPDQERACRAAWDGAGVVMIVGRAGTGKSHAIGALAEGYRQCGFTVVGLGPTNLIGQTLAAEPEITRGGTLHSELWHLEQGSRRWDRSTVVVVDEAAMVDSPTMARLTRAAAESGAKLILVGDARQLSSVERGGLFAELRDRLQGPVIETVTRQREDWQRRAAEHLAAGRHDLALSAFAAEGCLRWSETQDEARAALVRQWESDRIARPDRSRFVFAYTNEDVDQLNAALRAVRQRRGELGEEVLLPTDRGERLFAVGDRVQITATDKGVGLVNGQVGTIEAIRGRWVALRRDDGRRVEFDARRFHGFRHGYAGTIYKGQGRTLDETYLYHSRHWRSAASYVALTRQRHQALIFAATETAADTKALARQMARADDRRAASAYRPDEDWLKARAREEAARKIAAATAGVQSAPSGNGAETEHRVAPAPGPTALPPLTGDFALPPGEEDDGMEDSFWRWEMDEEEDDPVEEEPSEHDIQRQRQREAEETAALTALLLDGRAITRGADGRFSIEGLTRDQRESVDRYWLVLAAVAAEQATRQAEERERREAERTAAEQAALRALLLDGRSIARTADGGLSIADLTKEQLEAVDRHWLVLAAVAAQRAHEQALERQRAAEQASLKALLLDGRSITRTADGGPTVAGLTKEQLEAVKRHWPALSAVAFQQADEQERQRVARDIEERHRAVEQQAAVRDYLDWLAATKAELEAAKKAGSRKNYSAIVFRRRDAAVQFTAKGLMPVLRLVDPTAAEETLKRAARSDAEVSALVDRTMVKIASERVRVAIPQTAPKLIATLTATGTPEVWRTALADALALPSRVESAAALRSLAVEVNGLEQQASYCRYERGSLETAKQTADQAAEAASERLWQCCRRASRDPEADFPGLEALSHRITDEEAQAWVFNPPSGLLGGILFDREERQQANLAAKEAMIAALALRKAREAAQVATAKLDAYVSGPKGQSGQNIETALKAIATTLGNPESDAVISGTLIQAAEALERTAAPPTPRASAWEQRSERQGPKPQKQDYSQENDDGQDM